jgi:hypothetical protein
MSEKCSLCGGTLSVAPQGDVMSQVMADVFAEEIGYTTGFTVWKCYGCGSSFVRQGGLGNASRRKPDNTSRSKGRVVVRWFIGVALLVAIGLFVWKCGGR